jgi:hypothetical protein
MTGPVKNFSQPTGLSLLVSNMIPQISRTPRLLAFPYVRREIFVFFKFGLVMQSGTINIIGTTKLQKALIKLPLPPMMRQVLVTFPPIYKTRTGRARPLKGQLWPRTR